MELIKEISLRSGRIRQQARSLLLFSLFTAISIGIAVNANAQTFAEWFSQKKTQKKYLLQQIAALQVYSSYLRQGYDIATNGLGSITGYLNSENGLHSTYYKGLKNASLPVRNNVQVKEIMIWQQDILQQIKEINAVDGLSSEENKYLHNVCQAVLNDCDQQLNTLQNVVSDNKLEMSDAERLAAIGKIHAAMQTNYRCVSAFAGQVSLLATKRQQESDQVSATKKVYGIIN